MDHHTLNLVFSNVMTSDDDKDDDEKEEAKNDNNDKDCEYAKGC